MRGAAVASALGLLVTSSDISDFVSVEHTL